MKLSDLKVGDKFRFASAVERWGNAVVREYLGFVNHAHTFTLQEIGVGWEETNAEVELVTDPPKPKYRPYSDLRPLVGKVVVHQDGSHGVINWADSTHFQFGGADADLFPAQELLGHYTHLDGTPCGKLVE